MRSVLVRNIVQLSMVTAVVLVGVGLLSAIPPSVTHTVDVNVAALADLDAQTTDSLVQVQASSGSATTESMASDESPGLAEILLGEDDSVSVGADSENEPSAETPGHPEILLAQENFVLADEPAVEPSPLGAEEGGDVAATVPAEEPAEVTVLPVAMADALPVEEPAEPAVKTVAMNAPGQVAGRVLHPNAEGGPIDEPAEGYTVSFIQNGEVIGQTTTDANGNYTVSGLSPGLYNVTITHGNGVTAYTVQVLPATEAGPEVPDELIVRAGPFAEVPPIQVPPVYYQGPPGPPGAPGGGGGDGLGAALGLAGIGLGAAALGMGGGNGGVVIASPFIP